MRKQLLSVPVTLAILSALPARAATLTAFLQGASPQARSGFGFAVGVPLFTEILSLEFEYGRSQEELTSPSLGLVSGSLVLSLPVEVVRFRPYFATGFGFYRQKLAGDQETSFASPVGFGTYFRLGGPAHLRLDYRTIVLRGDPLQEKQKRFYAGISLKI